MNRIARIVIWICSKFNKADVVRIIQGLQQVLAEHHPEIKFKDDFKEKHPNYRDYYVDPLPPLTEKPTKQGPPLVLDWQELLRSYEQREGRLLRPIKPRKGFSVPKHCHCLHCGAPAQFLYFNDGQRKSQLRCKVCGLFFSIAPALSPH